MLSRRHFLGVSSAALAGTACQAGLPAQEDGADTDLPPSVAALEPQTHRATPITVDERRGRIEKARRLMGEHALDALMLTGGTSLLYFSGIRWGISERLLTLIVPAGGEPFVVCPAFEEERAREQLANGPFGGGTVLTWQEDENPFALVGQGLRDAGIATGVLGVEETVQHRFSHGVASHVPAVRLTDGTPVTAGCRMVKDEHELELMKLASEITLAAYHAAYLAMEEGMTQRDFGGLVAKAHEVQGTSGYASVQTDQWSALPHGSSTPQVIREGSIVMIDGGCGVEGYRSDLTRTFTLGEPTQKMKDVFSIELEAQTAALEAAGPGVPAEAVDAAARTVIEDAGYGPGYTYFTHRVGHGMGMDGHEWPYLVKGNTMPLEPGMTFSDEPGIYLPGEFGVRLEDDMYITEDGAALMTPQSPSLEDPFGVVA